MGVKRKRGTQNKGQHTQVGSCASQERVWENKTHPSVDTAPPGRMSNPEVTSQKTAKNQFPSSPFPGKKATGYSE